MNLCCFTGRLTATPELKSTPSGKSVCNFSLAVERRFSNSGGEKTVDYIDFVAWNHNADFLCKWFDKGVRVAITGEMQTRTYEDKDSGKKIKVCEVLVNTVEFADGKREANEVATNTTPTSNETDLSNASFDDDGFMPISNDDDLPY
jgi:single-strand DNA-binding protein